MKIKRFPRGESIFQSCPDSKNEEVTMTILLNFTSVKFFRKNSSPVFFCCLFVGLHPTTTPSTKKNARSLAQFPTPPPPNKTVCGPPTRCGPLLKKFAYPWFTPILQSQRVQRCLCFFKYIKLDSPPPEKTGSAQHQVETMSFFLSLIIIIIVVFKDEHRCNPKPGT